MNDTSTPDADPGLRHQHRCPPGHGDIYPSLLGSGMLERLRKGGIKYVFVSNSDNLGATLDLDLLAFFAKSDSAFTMEVAADMQTMRCPSCVLPCQARPARMLRCFHVTCWSGEHRTGVGFGWHGLLLRTNELLSISSRSSSSGTHTVAVM